MMKLSKVVLVETLASVYQLHKCNNIAVDINAVDNNTEFLVLSLIGDESLYQLYKTIEEINKVKKANDNLIIFIDIKDNDKFHFMLAFNSEIVYKYDNRIVIKI